MKAGRFTDPQKAFILKQYENGKTVSGVCREAGISQATYFNWKKRYGDSMPLETKRLWELENENEWSKKIIADLTIDREMFQDIIKLVCGLINFFPLGRISDSIPPLIWRS